jgi:hypothetical protein
MMKIAMTFLVHNELCAVLQSLAARSHRTMTTKIEARAKRLEASRPLTLLSAPPVVGIVDMSILVSLLADGTWADRPSGTPSNFRRIRPEKLWT